MPIASEAWPVTRCKRIVRPLVAKVHSLNELYANYPSIIDFDTTGFEATLRQHPSTSIDRLNALRPFVSPELFKHYQEIFPLFKTVLASLFAVRASSAANAPSKTAAIMAAKLNPSLKPDSFLPQKNTHEPNISSLSALCSYKVGQSMAVYSKSSHYKLNNSILFDKLAPTNESNESKQTDDMVDDIDHWLEQMEPIEIIAFHRPQLVVGYILHFLVFHLNTLLYTLMPVLIHWLHEQRSSNAPLAVLGRHLFHEFWYNNEDPSDAHSRVSGIFWSYLHTGYWEQLIGSLGLTTASTNDRQRSYPALVLDTLPLNSKLLSTAANPDMFNSVVWSFVLRVPQHFQLNSVLVYTLGNVIQRFRTDIQYNCPEPRVAEHLLLDALHSVQRFAGVWLGFSHDVFNSLVPGNSELFAALARFCSYCSSTTAKLEPYLDTSELEREFAGALVALEVLKSYYLFATPDVAVDDWASASMLNFVARMCTVGDKRSQQAEEFVLWAKEHNLRFAHQLAKKLYKKMPLYRMRAVLNDLFTASELDTILVERIMNSDEGNFHDSDGDSADEVYDLSYNT